MNKTEKEINTIDLQEEVSFSLKAPKIVIIDDSSENIRVLASLLSQKGYEVLTALDAYQGILITQAKLPDLILLDVNMPDMCGFDVCEHLKANKKTKDIPVIFITAVSDTGSILRGLEMGAVDYISKPFRQLELLAKVKNHLKFKRSSEYISALFESRYHSFITLNNKLEIVAFNEIANEREFQFNKTRYKKGTSILTHISEANRHSFQIKATAVLRGKTLSFERKYLCEQEEYWFNYLLEPIYNKQGEIIGCLMNGTDITGKKEYVIRANEYHRKIKENYTETQESLSYARYIQNSIYPGSEILKKQFPNHFVLFKSKEKVSGDLYWSHTHGDKDLMVIGDCTGHGVPGALLTTISIVLLERIVKQNGIMAPDEILSQMDMLLGETLRQKEGGIKVGLEMAICLFDKKKKTVEYAGAKRPLLMACGEDTFEIKPTRYDIGGSSEVKKFKKHILHPIKGSSLYMFSDGVIDQIGGISHKKFMKKKLERLIFSINTKPMEEQKEIFEKSIGEWIGKGEQTDDILLMGIKL